jgi:hypothetical protein
VFCGELCMRWKRSVVAKLSLKQGKLRASLFPRTKRGQLLFASGKRKAKLALFFYAEKATPYAVGYTVESVTKDSSGW